VTSAANVKSLLAEGLHADNLRQLDREADAWFRNEPGLPSFVVRAVFRELMDRGWDDPQA
jgi:hypothetical protein